MAKRLESRGIAKVPELPQDQEQQRWSDRVLDYLRSQRDFEKEQAAKRQAEQEAATAPKTTADVFRQTIATDIPLNGPPVIRAAGGDPYASNSSWRDFRF
jgi:hypothetical protein